MTDRSLEEQRRQLEDIKDILKQNQELYKGMFGLMFWQLEPLVAKMSFDEISKEAMSLTMSGEQDEALATLLGIYLQIWDSAKCFNAASRFMASSLSMSADELLQAKIIFDESSLK